MPHFHTKHSYKTLILARVEASHGQMYEFGFVSPLARGTSRGVYFPQTDANQPEDRVTHMSSTLWRLLGMDGKSPYEHVVILIRCLSGKSVDQFTVPVEVASCIEVPDNECGRNFLKIGCFWFTECLDLYEPRRSAKTKERIILLKRPDLRKLPDCQPRSAKP